MLVTSTQTVQSQAPTLAVRVTDAAGNVTTCDPVVPGALRRAHYRLSSRQHVHLTANQLTFWRATASGSGACPAQAGGLPPSRSLRATPGTRELGADD